MIIKGKVIGHKKIFGEQEVSVIEIGTPGIGVQEYYHRSIEPIGSEVIFIKVERGAE